MKIYIDKNKSFKTNKLKEQCKSLAKLEDLSFDSSLSTLISSDLDNIYSEIVNESTIVFYLRSPQQISFICKEIAKDFGASGLNLRIGLNELLMNSLEHGNFQIDKITKNNMISIGDYYEVLEILVEKNKSKYIRLQYTVKTPKNIIIEDQGKGFDFEDYLSHKDINDAEYCGRGIFIASQELPKNNAEFSYRDEGKTLVIDFKGK
ncbi:MAG: hypothetical protein GY793_04830 [Proteobacteria bacterium]|nr:hypothetical protein [Pseudomonadota bacterium]